jgi:DNA modification methylase
MSTEPKIAETPVTVARAKGRPMLTWVGKKPLGRVTAYPAQLIERFAVPGTAGLPLGAADWTAWPAAQERGGLLFHGDNKDVLAHLLANGFRGKVKLIYIDPPFDSGADYVRKVQLRGPRGTLKIDGEDYALGEQVQYTDIWSNDNYLQFMYERLLMLKDLLAEDGAIFLHCDPKRGHYLRCLLDEVFGPEAFRNEIVWWYWNKFQGNINRFASNHDSIYCYATGKPPYRKIKVERPEVVNQLARRWDSATGSLVNVKDASGNLVYIESDEKTLDDVWVVPMLQPADKTENAGYPTQKREEILQAIITSSSDRGDLVLDCFIGSGTTAAVAQKLGRSWIGCDINKGAIQTTAKRLQGVMAEQAAALAAAKQAELVEAEGALPRPCQFAFTTWRVNDYDLQIQHNEAAELVAQHLGVTRTRTDPFFDGTCGNQLVNLVPLNHPLSPLDCESLRNELKNRPQEERDVMLVCLGIEQAARQWIEQHNNASPVNKVHVVELRTDRRAGGVIRHEPMTASVSAQRSGDQLIVTVEDAVSPSILQRLQLQHGVLRA